LDDKKIFAIFVISIISSLQVVAWYCGHNGTVFAFSSLIIGAVVGSILGFSLKK